MPHGLPPLVFTGADIGFSAKTMAAAADGNALTCEQYNQLTLTIKHTFSAGTAITFFLLTGEATTRMGAVMAGELSAGVDTYTKRQWSVTTSSVSDVYTIQIPLSAAFWQLKTVTVTSGGAGDILTIDGRLANV